MKELIYENDLIKGWIFSRKDAENLYIQISESLKRFRKSLKTNNILKAKQTAYKIIESYEAGFYESPNFKSVAAEFLKTMTKETTKKYYIGRLNAVFYPIFGNKKISEITEKEIYDLQIERLKKIKPDSVNKEMVVLKQIFKYAEKRKYIEKMPEIEKRKEGEKKKRNAFSEKEIEEIFSIAEKRIAETTNNRTKFDRTILLYFIKFLYETGIREGEALSIKFGGISDDTAFLTKSKTKIREIYLNNEALKIIDELKNLYKKYDLKIDDDNYIFLNFAGNQAKSLKKSFTELLKKTSMKNKVGKNELTLYSFRHSYITKAIKKGIPLTTIAIQCGNSLKIIESNYNHLNIHSVKNELK